MSLCALSAEDWNLHLISFLKVFNPAFVLKLMFVLKVHICILIVPRPRWTRSLGLLCPFVLLISKSVLSKPDESDMIGSIDWWLNFGCWYHLGQPCLWFRRGSLVNLLLLRQHSPWKDANHFTNLLFNPSSVWTLSLPVWASASTASYFKNQSDYLKNCSKQLICENESNLSTNWVKWFKSEATLKWIGLDSLKPMPEL